MIVAATLAMLLAPAATHDRYSVTTDRARGEALARRWRRCGTPVMKKLATNRMRVTIALAADADYVVADCIATQARGLKIDRTTKGPKA